MALAGSNAGMRLIAQCSLLKRGDEARLREFLRSGYTEAALQQSPAASAWPTCRRRRPATAV